MSNKNVLQNNFHYLLYSTWSPAGTGDCPFVKFRLEGFGGSPSRNDCHRNRRAPRDRLRDAAEQHPRDAGFPPLPMTIASTSASPTYSRMASATPDPRQRSFRPPCRARRRSPGPRRKVGFVVTRDGAAVIGLEVVDRETDRHSIGGNPLEGVLEAARAGSESSIGTRTCLLMRGKSGSDG